MGYLLIAFFLPLFPFSIAYNALFVRIRDYRVAMLIMIVWPASGIYMALKLGGNPPEWVAYWAAFTAVLYAFRSLVMRDLRIWTAYMATSVWALLWLVFPQQSGSLTPWLITLMLALPMALMPLVTGWITHCFGGAYAGSVNGLAMNVPRISLLLVFAVMAVIATPIFPGFFVLLGMVNKLLPAIPFVALGILLVWMLWTWSGVRILQGFLVGPRRDQQETDINLSMLSVIVMPLLVYIIAGLLLSGELL
jgi:hypothetical protein